MCVRSQGCHAKRLGMPAQLVGSLDRDTLAVALDIVQAGVVVVEEIGRKAQFSDEIELGQLDLQAIGARPARVGSQVHEQCWLRTVRCVVFCGLCLA